jgi:chromosome partitioning protein
MAITISFLNMKGGVGKSTLAVNFAQYLAGYTAFSKKVLLVDLDPQSNASQYALGVTRYTSSVYSSRKPHPTTWDIFEQFAKVPGRPNPINLKPSDVILNVTTYDGAGRIDLIASRLDLASSLDSPAHKENLLREFLALVQSDYDAIILDVPPTETLFTTAAYFASEHMIVPVKPEFLSTVGLPLMQESLNRFHQRSPGHKVNVAGIVFNYGTDYHPEETKAIADVRNFSMTSGWPILKTTVPYTRSLPKGARLGQPLFFTSNARRTSKNAFFLLTQEIAQQVGL